MANGRRQDDLWATICDWSAFLLGAADVTAQQPCSGEDDNRVHKLSLEGTQRPHTKSHTTVQKETSATQSWAKEKRKEGSKACTYSTVPQARTEPTQCASFPNWQVSVPSTATDSASPRWARCRCSARQGRERRWTSGSRPWRYLTR